MFDNSFYETMNAHPNAKLIDIVENKRDDYQPEAIAAAEMVLKYRNVKFKTPEPVEIVPMTVDEIRADIDKRIASGETFQEVRKDYRSMGVDINTIYQRESSNSSSYADYNSYRRKRAGGYFVGIGIACFTTALKTHNNQTLIAIGLLLIGAGAFFLIKPRG